MRHHVQLIDSFHSIDAYVTICKKPIVTNSTFSSWGSYQRPDTISSFYGSGSNIALTSGTKPEKSGGVWVWLEGFPFLWDVFLCIFGFYNENELFWRLNLETTLDTPMSQ